MPACLSNHLIGLFEPDYHSQVLALTVFYAGRYHLRFRRWQEIRLSDLCLSPYLTS